MYIYSDYHPEGIEKVSLGAVRFLTTQLDEFVTLYEKKILLKTPEEKEALAQLKIISQLLSDERFDQLITDPKYVIDFSDNEDYLPSYYPL